MAAIAVHSVAAVLLLLIKGITVFKIFIWGGISSDIRSERGTCIKGLFWPPLEPKTENYFSPISLDWFIRRITEV